MRRMKIVVTGAAGFIGSHTCERLAKQGHDVIGFDSFDNYLYDSGLKRQNALEIQKSLSEHSFSLTEANILDTAALETVLQDADVVCHLAALAGVRPSLVDPARYVRTNVEGTVLLLEACRNADVDRVVLASSSSVYGARDTSGAFAEDDPCLECASPYGATKRAGELMSKTFSDVYGLGISALRFFTVYGPRQRPDMAIHKFVRAAVTGEPVPLYGDGTSRRDYTYVDDIVTGTVGAIEGVQPGAFEIYNLGGAQTTSLAELIDIVEGVTGLTVPVDRQPDQLGDVPNTYANITRAKAAFGYNPATDVRTGLARFWSWYQQHDQAASSHQ